MKDNCTRIFLEVLMNRLNNGVPIGQANSEAAESVESYITVIEECEEEPGSIPESFLIKESLHKETIKILGRLKESIICSLAVTEESQARDIQLGISRTSFGQPYCKSLSKKGIICTCHNCSLYRDAQCIYEQGKK